MTNHHTVFLIRLLQELLDILAKEELIHSVPIKTTKILFDLMLFLIVRLVLSCVFLILPLLFSFFSASPSKATPLESGFVPLDESSSHFNNQFFIILVIFVIFDLEVILSICVVCLSLDRWFFWILISFIGITLLFEW